MGQRVRQRRILKAPDNPKIPGNVRGDCGGLKGSFTLEEACLLRRAISGVARPKVWEGPDIFTLSEQQY